MQDFEWDNAQRREPRTVDVLDPVCGMRLQPRDSAGTRVIRGQTVFFCSTICLEKFDSSPEHYSRMIDISE